MTSMVGKKVRVEFWWEKNIDVFLVKILNHEDMLWICFCVQENSNRSTEHTSNTKSPNMKRIPFIYKPAIKDPGYVPGVC